MATRFDKFVASRVPYIWVILEEVKKMVKKYYQRDAEVIYPPVKTEDIKPTLGKGFFLLPGAIMPEKRIDLVVEVFKKTDQKLVICGEGALWEEWLRGMIKKAKNIDYLGPVSEERLKELYLNSGRSFLLENQQSVQTKKDLKKRLLMENLHLYFTP